VKGIAQVREKETAFRKKEFPDGKEVKHPLG
jgi:hypothetical protein